MTWPLDNMAYANSTTRTHVIGETSIANSLHHSARIILAGKPRRVSDGGGLGALNTREKCGDVYPMVRLRFPFSMPPRPPCNTRIMYLVAI